MKSDAEIARTLREVFISQNICDSRLEPANVVDVLYGLSKAIHHLAESIEGSKDHVKRESS